MVTAKLLNYTFVPRSESSMQIAPPKGDDDVDVVPCLRERGKGGRRRPVRRLAAFMQ